MEKKNEISNIKVGEFVIIKENLSETRKIGKIEEIFEEDGFKVFRYNEYYFPERTQGNHDYIYDYINA